MSPKPRDLPRRHAARRTLHVGLLVGVVMGACALAVAGVPHTFNDGDTLEAAHLNANFAALDQRIAALEAKDPFSGTYPAVFGLGTGYDGPKVPGADRGGTWFCGSAPTSLELESLPDPSRITFSHAFGSILFTNAGKVALNLDFPWIEHGSASICGPEHAVCSAPLTFFLKSPKAQTLRIQSVLDDAGAIYVTGDRLMVPDLGAFPNQTDVPVPEGPFALSFMACSKSTVTTTGNITLAFGIYDAFLTNPSYGLTVDYDRTFHRNGQ